MCSSYSSAFLLTDAGGQKQEYKNKSIGQGVQPFLEIEGGSGEKQIDRIADSPFEIVSGQTEIIFQMSYNRFDRATASEVFSGFAFGIF